MVQLVLFLDAAQDRNRVFHRRFLNDQRLEPPRQSRVFFDVFPVFVRGCGTHAMQLASRQSRLQQVRCIHRTIGLARTHKRVHLVDKQDHLTCRRGYFVQNAFQAFLKFTAILRTGNQSAHVQRQQLLVAQTFRHIAIHDPQSQTFGNRRLPNTGIANQDRVVLCAPRQHLHGAANFLIPANDRVNLAIGCRFGQIARVLLQRIITVLSRRRIRRAPFAHIIDRTIQRLRRHATGIQGLFRLRRHNRQSRQHPFHRHKTIARLLGQPLRLVQNFCGLAIHIGLARIARHLRHFAQG